MNKKVFVILFLFLNSCFFADEYKPVGTNCSKRSEAMLGDFVFDSAFGLNKDENGDYDYNLEYKECIKSSKIKKEYSKKLQDENYELDYYEKEKLKKINDKDINKQLEYKEFQELKKKNDLIKNSMINKNN